jgi:D-arabinose 5-phosphate isomerase GutQ
MRVRGFTQDDAHIICTPEQLNEEVEKLLSFSLGMLRAFGFQELTLYLATRPEKAVGEPEDWARATEALRQALISNNIEYKMDEGGGAFYGPKIDIKIKDSLGRSWQCSTIQFDFNLANRFGMEYVGADNQPHRPYMIHRALLGSIERFFGVLVEHYAGNFPVWLCPVQVMVVPVSENFSHYAERKLKALRKAGIRAEMDRRSEKMGYKIREAETRKIPYMFILGQREEDTNMVAVRRHGKGDLGQFTLEEAIEKIQAETGKILARSSRKATPPFFNKPRGYRMDALSIAREELLRQAQAIQLAAERMGEEMNRAVELVLNCRGKVVTTGMGKTGIIARKIAATLASTGVTATYLHPAEGIHGDLGILTGDDLVIAVSQTGATQELLAIVPYFHFLKIPVIAFTGNTQSKLAMAANVVISTAIPRDYEPFNLVPTASTTVALALGDALAVSLIRARNFCAEDFSRFHPAAPSVKSCCCAWATSCTPASNYPLYRTTPAWTPSLWNDR